MNAKHIFSALLFAAVAACAQDATWLPANSTGALALDYKALRAIPMVAKLIDNADQSSGNMAMQGVSSGQMAIIKEVQKDVSKLLVAVLPGATPNEPRGVSFVSGTFDTAQIAAKLKADPNCTVSVKDGVTVYAPKSATGKPTYAVFPSKGLIVGSDNLDALFAGLKTMQKKAPALASESMISRAIAKNFPLVLVADTSFLSKQGVTMPVGGALPSFCAFTLRAKDAAHLLANLTGVFASDEEAAQMATTLNGMKMLYAAQLAANPEAAPLANLLAALSVGSNGKNATASATIDEALIISLSNLVPNMAVPASAR